MPHKDYGLIYREVQPYSQLWIWGVVLILALFAWFTFIEQIILATPIGNYPAPDALLFLNLAVFGILVPAIARSMKLVVEVYPSCLIIRFTPFVRKVIPYTELSEYEVCRFNPLADYGGYGIRSLKGKGWAYLVNGFEGVSLYLHNGRQILVGSPDAGRLFDMITEAVRDQFYFE